MAEQQRRTPNEEVRRLYEEAETRTARAMEDLVGRDSFGELLARMTENLVSVTKMSSDAFDLVLRNLRVAGRQDITRLARQIARTEDKLERVLQEVERPGQQLEERQGEDDGKRNGRRSTAEARSRAGAGATRGGGDEAPES